MKIYRCKVIDLLFSTPAKNRADAFRAFKAMARAVGMNEDWVKLNNIRVRKGLK